MDEDQLWRLEKSFWLDGVSVYEAHLHNDALMIFPGVGLLNRIQILESLRGAPRWTALEMHDRRVLRAGGAVVLVYTAEARRGADQPYRAFCSSSYIPADSGWKMLTHQQTQAARISDAT